MSFIRKRGESECALNEWFGRKITFKQRGSEGSRNAKKSCPNLYACTDFNKHYDYKQYIIEIVENIKKKLNKNNTIF